jgi:transposase
MVRGVFAKRAFPREGGGLPDAPVSPKGGRPAMDKRRALRGIFWILDNGAEWKDLPEYFGSKSPVHRYFTM